MTVAKAGLKLGVLVVAMLAAIGAWEVYKETVKVRGEAHAQDESEGLVLIRAIHGAVVDAGDGFGPRLHFKCYGITPGGPSLNKPVTLFDQFFPPEREDTGEIEGGDHVTVRARHHLCTPTLKLVESTPTINRGK